MKYIISLLFIFLASNSVFADSVQLVKEKEIKKWGYQTLSYQEENFDNKTTKTQVIKSIKQAPGLEDHYYYYSLSEECYSSYIPAQKRKMGLIILDEKEYTLSELEGKCVRIINTSAKFAMFNEQPRIFTLFNKYLDENNGI